MRVVFRVDSAHYMGSGHVMRCLNLAKTLARRDVDVSFICRELPGHLGQLLCDSGFDVHLLPAGCVDDGYGSLSESDTDAWLTVTPEEDAAQSARIVRDLSPVAWLIVDHYGIDARWERVLRPLVGRIMVLDDLANRPHECDLLLDQNFVPNLQQRYRNLVSPACHFLLGPKYALLREEFIDVSKVQRQRDGGIRNILIFMGGMDPVNITRTAIDGLMSLTGRDFLVDVIVGGNNPNRDDIARRCNLDRRFSFACQVDDMAERLNRADLVIGAGGATSWERCLLGVPAAVVVVAENQQLLSRHLQEQGAVTVVAEAGAVTPRDIALKVADLMDHPGKVRAMVNAARAVMAGYSNGADEVCGWLDRVRSNDNLC